jgi:hypothetical protein
MTSRKTVRWCNSFILGTLMVVKNKHILRIL